MPDPEPPTPPKTILVSGAFGQIGQRLTTLLLERGRTVVALDLRSEPNEALARTLTAHARGSGTLVPAFVDLLDPEAVRDLVAEHEPQVIVHLAAILAPTAYLDPARARRVNVEGTTNLLRAASALSEPPFFVECSSSAVHGSRNPHRHSDRLTAPSAINPVDCYGEDKAEAEALVKTSGLSHATLRLGGVISADAASSSGEDKVLARATPRDNRIHMVDARDAALAFANAADRGEAIAGKTLMIAGDETCALDQQTMTDDIMQALGIGRLGPSSNLPGDPDDDQGWSLTDWFDTSEAQALLDFQQHTWQQTLDEFTASVGRRRLAYRTVGPVLRPLMRLSNALQRRRDKRGRYADPWALIERKYGATALASTARTP